MNDCVRSVFLLLSFVAFGCGSESSPALVGMDATVPASDGALEPTTDMAVEPAGDTALPDGDTAEPDSGDMTVTDDMALNDAGQPDAGDQSAACEETCRAVADCLVEECRGFRPNMRRVLRNRCGDLCTPALMRQLEGLTCTEPIEVIAADIPQVEDACIEATTGEGTNALYIGHSFGRPFAENLEAWAANAGIDDHVQNIVFRGGESGAPQALLNNPEARSEIESILDEGNTNLLIMICCSQSFRNFEGDPAIRYWMDYALERNENTRFGLAMPWPDFPADYNSAAEYADLWNLGNAAWRVLIEGIRADYPGVDVFSIPHGRAALELRFLFEAGELNDVGALTRQRQQNVAGIFTDAKGHADRILKDLGTLVWLGAIHDIDVTMYPLDMEYETDLRAIADTILSEEPFAR